MSFNREIADYILRHTANVSMLEKSIVFQIVDRFEDEMLAFAVWNAKEVRKLVREAFLAALKWFEDELVTIYLTTRRTIGSLFVALSSGVLVEQIGVVQFGPPSLIDARKAAEEILHSKSWLAQQYKLTQAASKKATEAFALGLEAGETPRLIAKRLAKVLPHNNVKSLVRTGLMQINNKALDDSIKNNKQLLAGIMFLATLDDRTCTICASYDKVVYWNTPAEGQESANALPRRPIHINCRCCVTPVVKDINQLAQEMGLTLEQFPPGARQTLDSRLASVKNYSQWLKEQPKIIQLGILGKTKYNLFSSGVPINKFVVGNRTLTVDELLELTPGEVAIVPEIKPIPKFEAEQLDLSFGDVTKGTKPTPLLSKSGIEVTCAPEKVKVVKEIVEKAKTRIPKPSRIDYERWVESKEYKVAYGKWIKKWELTSNNPVRRWSNIDYTEIRTIEAGVESPYLADPFHKAEYQALTRNFNQVLDEAPVWRGDMYRGLVVRRIEDYQKFTKVGNIIHQNASASFSKAETVGKFFAFKYEGTSRIPARGRMLLRVREGRGVDITPMSRVPEELEVVARKGESFRILQVQEQAYTSGMFEGESLTIVDLEML